MGKKKKAKSPENDELRGEDGMDTSTSVAAAASVSNRIVICKSKACFDIATVSDFCRLHYLSNWKKLKEKEAKKKGSALEEYLKELSNRFPEEYLDRLKAEIEEAAERPKEASEERDEKPGFFEAEDGDEDMDTIIRGIRVEDY